MNLEIYGHQVLAVEEVVTEKQTAIVKTHYDMLKHTEIYTPEQIFVGQPTDIRILCKNYLNELLTEENTPVTVEVNGVAQEFVPLAGEVVFTVTCDLSGDITIKTAVDKWRNDEKVIKGV